MAAGGFFSPPKVTRLLEMMLHSSAKLRPSPLEARVVLSGEKTPEVDSYKTRCIIMGFQLPTNW